MINHEAIYAAGLDEHARVWDGMDAPIITNDGSPVKPIEFFKRWVASPYGIYMANQPLRYSVDYGYPDLFRDVGADAHPNGHMLATAIQLGKVLRAQLAVGLSLKPADIATLHLICLVHDTGESMHPEIEAEVGAVVGDIPAGRKTPKQRSIETKVRRIGYREVMPDLKPETINTMEAIITHQPQPGTLEDEQHEYYEITHDTLYLETALIADGAVARKRLLKSNTDIDTPDRLVRALRSGIQPRVRQRAGRFALAAAYAA